MSRAFHNLPKVSWFGDLRRTALKRRCFRFAFVKQHTVVEK